MNERLIAQHRIDTPLGGMLLAAPPAGVAGAWFEGQAHHPGVLSAPHDAAQRWLAQAALELQQYFSGLRRQFDVALDPRGTEFQQRVWALLRNIPWGARNGYGSLATALGKPQAARAVGAAVGRNPLSVIVPCHRVVGHGGELTGYAGGLPRKEALLALEAAGLPGSGIEPDQGATLQARAA
ncbi:MAG: methylated-DNA--[protein]-cysteine S-methyltransferase [Rubrivivax sp.]|nr:methylated-DNA--[protein]-cysteine S-methyltransferase [Rubrivivax sp.]